MSRQHRESWGACLVRFDRRHGHAMERALSSRIAWLNHRRLLALHILQNQHAWKEDEIINQQERVNA